MTRVHFDATPVVWVSVASPDRMPYRIDEDHHQMIVKFMQWMWDNKIYSFKTTSCGGGQWHGAFYPEDWPRVEQWLLENGFTAGSIETPRPAQA